jgi:RNA-directed DNA polymerase
MALKIRRLAGETSPKIDFKRVYIPKDKGKFRPLGVPKAAYRVWLHMLNQLLVNWFLIKGLYPDSQHGFIPKRGTMTAWKQILNDVIQAKDIYEFDLKGLFDIVKLDAIVKELAKAKIPEWVNDYIYSINSSLVSLKPPYRIDESEAL